MKITFRQTASNGLIREIILEDESPLMTQYTIPKGETIDSFDLPPDSLGGFVRPISNIKVEITFPLVEKLCREIFSEETIS